MAHSAKNTMHPQERLISLAAKGAVMIKHRWRMSVAVATGVLLLSSTLLVAMPQSGQATQTMSDSAITNAIEAKLFRDPALKTQDIHVSTAQGVVTLSGTVDTQSLRDAADRIASYQPGVVKVIDSMSVGSAAPVTSTEGANGQYPASSQPADQGQQYPGNAAPQQPQYEPVPSTLVIPAGTTLTVRLTQGLSTDVNKPGDAFSAMLEDPVVADGWVVARHGQTLMGRVDTSQKGGRIKGVSQLGISLTELTLVNGQQMPIQTQLVQSSAGPSKGRDAAAVGTTTGIGAMIGAIAGEGEGAGIGAAAGAAAGIAGVLLTHGRPTVIPAEALLIFRLNSSVTISTVHGTPAFRQVTQQDYPQHELRPRPERVVMTPQPYYAPPYGGYYGWPYYGGWGWGFGYGYPYYYGPGFVGVYRYGGGYYRGDHREWHGDRGGRGDWHGDRGGRGDHGGRGRR